VASALHAHLALVTKYRRDTRGDSGAVLREFNGEQDHARLLVEYRRKSPCPCGGSALGSTAG
jgi:hypothetical protein